MKNLNNEAISKHLRLGLAEKTFAYLNNVSNDFGVSFLITLKNKIDPSSLQYAVEKTAERYLLLRVKMVLNDDGYTFELNDKPISIKELPHYREFTLGEESNDYLWQVNYFENQINFLHNHCLFDGMGVACVRKTLIYYYFEALGIHPSESHDILTLNDDVNALLDQECELTLETYHRDNLKPLPEIELLESDHISDRYLNDLNDKGLGFSFSINSDTFIPLIKRYETTPFALFAPILARSARYLFDEGNPNIGVTVLVNSRPYTKSKTLRNTIVDYNINYCSETMDKRDLSFVSTIFRSILDVKLNEDNILTAINKAYEKAMKVESIPLEEREQYLAENFSEAESPLVSNYGGIFKLPKEFESEMESVEVISRVSHGHIFAQIIQFKNRLRLVITSKLNDTTYIENIKAIFDELNIDYTCERFPDLEDLRSKF